MPSHWSSPKLNIVSGSSPTGTQFVQSVGCAHAGRYLHPDSDEVTLVTAGEGATSEGEFWEALNGACLDKTAGFVFDRRQRLRDLGSGGTADARRQHRPPVERVPRPSPVRSGRNGLCGFVASVAEAIAHCRGRGGPALVHALVTRPYSHSLSDDERSYKTKAERAAEEARDPLAKFPEWLVGEGILDRHALQRMAHEIDQEIQSATDLALRAEPPARGSAMRIPLFGSRRSRPRTFSPRSRGSAASRGRWWTKSTARWPRK